jgi:glycosyltransferase involved in cell wall biosynthesis
MVANLRQAKGYEYFVQSARAVVDVIPESYFLAVGETAEAMLARLQDLVRQLKLDARVSFLGFRKDIPGILRDLDVFVLTSTSEGLSISTIEAMAAGKPVVVTRSGGPEEIVEDGITGYLVPPADAGALAARVCEILRNPEFGRCLGSRAQAAVAGKFSLQGMVEQYESLYQRCLGEN